MGAEGVAQSLEKIKLDQRNKSRRRAFLRQFSNLAVIDRLALIRKLFGRVQVHEAVAAELAALPHVAGRQRLAEALPGRMDR